MIRCNNFIIVSFTVCSATTLYMVYIWSILRVFMFGYVRCNFVYWCTTLLTHHVCVFIERFFKLLKGNHFNVHPGPVVFLSSRFIAFLHNRCILLMNK